MANYKIGIDFNNKSLEIDNKFYHFEFGKLIITGGDKPIEGTYYILQKEKRYYLVTKPEIVKGKKEIPIDILLDEKFILLNV